MKQEGTSNMQILPKPLPYFAILGKKIQFNTRI